MCVCEVGREGAGKYLSKGNRATELKNVCLLYVMELLGETEDPRVSCR